jgi:hypothetical protein
LWQSPFTIRALDGRNDALDDVIPLDMGKGAITQRETPQLMYGDSTRVRILKDNDLAWNAMAVVAGGSKAITKWDGTFTSNLES